MPDQSPPNPMLERATSALKLTPQEQYLYQHHLDNLTGPGGVTNANGSRSTLKQTSVESDGKTYNIPTIWDGKALQAKDALKRAKAEGLEKFPSYPDENTAESRYSQMHGFIERDTSEAYPKRNPLYTNPRSPQ